MTVVYCLTAPSGKQYIGVTNNLQRRLTSHCRANTLIGRSIRKYGLESINVQTLLIGDTPYCYLMEKSLVYAYDTLHPRGYNQTAGGLGGVGVTPEVNARRGASIKAWWSDPGNKEQEARRRRTPEELAWRRRAQEARWADPEKRQALLTSRNTKEALDKKSLSIRTALNKPERLVAARTKQAALWANPAFRTRMLEAQRNKRLEKSSTPALQQHSKEITTVLTKEQMLFKNEKLERQKVRRRNRKIARQLLT